MPAFDHLARRCKFRCCFPVALPAPPPTHHAASAITGSALYHHPPENTALPAVQMGRRLQRALPPNHKPRHLSSAARTLAPIPVRPAPEPHREVPSTNF